MDISANLTPLSTRKANPSCAICRKIAAFVQSFPAAWQSLMLGTWNDFLANVECEVCQHVIHAFSNRSAADTFSTHSPFRPSCKLSMRICSGTPELTIDAFGCHGINLEEHGCGREHDSLRLIALSAPWPRHYDLQLYPRDPFWIDSQRIQRWAKYCDSHHQGTCHHLSEWGAVNPAPALILVDVYDACLTVVAGSVQYLALSYVWGPDHAKCQLKRANYSVLTAPGSLRQGSSPALLPETIHDAIKLTKSVEIRYLWVDRLCIIQDDPAHVHEQIRLMSNIYANSYFTIIAAVGEDANHGLRGVRETSPRTFSPSALDFSPDCRVMEPPVLEGMPSPSKWHTRGWTFQERTISKRCLVFFEETVFWECESSTWREELLDEPDAVKIPESLQLTFKPRWCSPYKLNEYHWPSLETYGILVDRYCTRSLTYPHDALRAFSAIIDVMSKSFHRGFLFGIPEFFFDICLLWGTDLDEPLVRRVSDGSCGWDFSIPSWSWVGWKGSVNPTLMLAYDPLWAESRVPPSAVPFVEIRRLIQFYKSVTSRPHKKYSVDNSYHKWQSLRSSCDADLPQGWTRIKFMQEFRDDMSDEFTAKRRPILAPDYLYSHSSIPSKLFWYPFPISDKPRHSSTTRWSPLLSFTSCRCRLGLGAEMRGSSLYYGGSCLKFWLTDHAGNVVGILQTNTNCLEELTNDPSFELIALSMGIACELQEEHVQDYLPELRLLRGLQQRGRYEFYNVMWIEWKDGIAYRKGIGRAFKEDWDAQELEQIDVILG